MKTKTTTKTSRYRTKKETIELFKDYCFSFEVDAARETNKEKQNFYLGKAEAYRIAAFELEHNMK